MTLKKLSQCNPGIRSQIRGKRISRSSCFGGSPNSVNNDEEKQAELGELDEAADTFANAIRKVLLRRRREGN